MTWENMFHIRRGVLQFHRPPTSGELLFLCWPVLVYRVTAPVLRVRHLNIIEKVVLALCRAGIREPREIAARIHQSAELCDYVLRQLRDGGQIDRHGTPTDQGRETLAAQRIGEEPELIVTHVFQEPVTGRLWPRASQDLVFQRVHSLHDDQAKLRLDTAGTARLIDAHIVPADLNPARIRPPGAQEIIDSVAAQRQAELARRAEQLTERHDGRSPAANLLERDLQALSTELAPPPQNAVHRVFETGHPMAEFVLLWLCEGELPGVGFQVRDPFGLDPNRMLQRLLADRIRTDTRLADVVTGAVQPAAIRDAEEYRARGDAVKRGAEASLVRRLGSELRLRPDVMELLLGVEEGAARGGESGAESVAREAFRLYEYLFRRMVAEYPPPDRPSWAAGRQTPSRGSVRSALVMAAKNIGLHQPPRTYFKDEYVGRVCSYPEQIRMNGRAVNSDRGYVNDLFLYVLTAATDPQSPHRAIHPVRELARSRPKVLTDLNELRQLRNRGSHERRDATVEDDINWCRALALDAARLLISMPPPPAERN